jgi:lipoprotein-releasing system ATP-binding protein
MSSGQPIGDVRMAGAAEPTIVADAVSREFVGGDGLPLRILDGVDLRVDAGETIAIIGESGAGKSTLLQILGGLDRPTEGRVYIGGADIGDMTEERLSKLRSRCIGFVFQFHHLLREFTALENVMMPQLIAGEPMARAREQARELLAQVSLEHRLHHKPAQLSGGEQQRVAVARALANRPLALLADEPSGNLDPHTSERLHDLIFEISRAHASAMVLVTHNRELAARADRMLRVDEGRLVAVEDFFDMRADSSHG